MTEAMREETVLADNEKSLLAVIEAAEANANQRVSDKPAIGVSDLRRIEAYRIGQIIVGCRKYPGVIADVIWTVLSYPYHRNMTDDEIDRLDYNILDRDGNFLEGSEGERLTAL